MFLAVKTVVSALIIVAISEIAKKHTLAASILAAMPLMSLLTFVWLYVETGDSAKIASLSISILLMVLPTLPFFLILPWMIGRNFGVPMALILTCLAQAAIYLIYVKLLARFGVTF